jgi:hypothetical protein
MKTQQLQPIGEFRFCWAGGHESLYTWRPVYEYRRRYLPRVRRVMTQVLVMCLGAPTWINVNPNDVRLEDSDVRS